MERFVWPEETQTWRVEWNSVGMVYGEQLKQTSSGVEVMLGWCVDSWLTLTLVSDACTVEWLS